MHSHGVRFAMQCTRQPCGFERLLDYATLQGCQYRCHLPTCVTHEMCTAPRTVRAGHATLARVMYEVQGSEQYFVAIAAAWTVLLMHQVDTYIP